MAIHPAIPDEQVASLISACQRGDASALEALYELYVDRLYCYIVARIGDLDAAADLTSEVFLRVVQNVDRFRPNRQHPAASFSAWIYRIAANLVADHYRHKGTHEEACLEEAERLPAHGAGPDGLAERREAFTQLAEALETLVEEQRLVVIGKFVDEMSNAEMADCLGKSEGAVKSLQHRALQALGRVLRVKGALR
jgi:RNA polymerase sigma-70 factor, ECF subfamily